MKYSLVCLPAAANAAASLTRATNAAWPAFEGTLSSILSAESTLYTATSSNSGALYTTNGMGYWGYRTGAVYFPANNMTGGGTAVLAVASFGSSGNILHSFYSFKAAPSNPGGTAGTGPSGSPSSSDYKNAAAGVYHMTCGSTTPADDQKKCYGGIWQRDGASSTANIAKRLLINSAGTVASKIKQKDGSTDQASNKSNVDIVLGALYHVADVTYGTAASGAWCSTWINKLTTAKTYDAPQLLDARTNFGKLNKCSWQILPSDGTMGPQFRLKSASSMKFQLQYIEWFDITKLGNGSVLPTTEANAYYLGAYAVGSSTNEQYLNPLVTSANYQASGTDAAILPSWTNISGTDFPAGSIGGVTQYTESGLEQKFDSAAHFKFIAAQTAANASYTTAKTAFETQVTAFNTAAAAWNTDKKGDIMSAVRIFPDTSVGKMYCPSGLSGIDLSGAAAFDASSSNAFKSSPFNAVPAIWNFATAASVSETYRGKMAIAHASWLTAAAEVTKRSSQIGWLLVAADDSASTLADSKVGHVFGILGQGAAATPGKGVSPYRYQGSATVSSSDKPGIQVSAFPSQAVTAFTSSQSVVIEASEAAWMTKTAGMMPSCPGAPTALTVLGAKAMAATVVAAATVAATLY